MSETVAEQNFEQKIRALRPDCVSIKRFDGGDNRDVFVVDDREVFRFPKNDSGVEAGQYEFAVLQLIRGRLSVEVPEPIELAADGSYNILSFLPGKVLPKHAVAELSYEKRRNLGIAIAGVIRELNGTVRVDDIAALQPGKSMVRNRDPYYAEVYETARQQQGEVGNLYVEHYERLQQLRPTGSASNVVVFGDLSSPNLVLSEDDELIGIIDWTDLGVGDIHNELRPVFSVIGSQAFDEMVASLDPRLGPVDKNLVRNLAVVHELAILVNGKQRGQLTPERTALAQRSIETWLSA